jgi:hypothetical protein
VVKELDDLLQLKYRSKLLASQPQVGAVNGSPGVFAGVDSLESDLDDLARKAD